MVTYYLYIVQVYLGKSPNVQDNFCDKFGRGNSNTYFKVVYFLICPDIKDTPFILDALVKVEGCVAFICTPLPTYMGNDLPGKITHLTHNGSVDYTRSLRWINKDVIPRYGRVVPQC